MSGRGRGKQLTRPAWMHNSRHPPPSLPQAPRSSSSSEWVKAQASDGRPYWYSSLTGKTTWSDPSLSNPDPPRASASAPEPDPRSPSVWKKHRTDDGRVYYYNTVSKQTQWNPPAETPTPTKFPASHNSPNPSVPAQPSAAPSISISSGPSRTELAEGWAEHRTQDGKTYYYHSVTRETRWEKPLASSQSPAVRPQLSGIKRPAELVNGSGQDDARPSLPPDWAESRTADGKLYYYNKVTRQSSWVVPSGEPDLKRPRVTADLRNAVTRAQQQREKASRKSESSTRVVRRPRSSEGKPLTDRQAENFFLKRAAAVKETNTAKKHKVSASSAVTSIIPESEKSSREKFYELLQEKGVTEKSSWLETMALCGADPRYLLVKPYGQRKDCWLRFSQKKAKSRRRRNILERRHLAEEFHDLMSVTFSKEAHNVTSLSRCHPDAVKAFETERRYDAVDGRERPLLIKAFFSVRARKGAIEHAKRRKKAVEHITSKLEEQIHPSLLIRTKQKNADHPEKESSTIANEIQSSHEQKSDTAPMDTDESKRYFDEHSSMHDIENFIKNLPGYDLLEKDDFNGLLRSWKRHLDTLVRERKLREREERKAQQRTYRAAFRNGIEGMLLSGTLPINPRWKEVRETVAKEKFARSESELDARPVDLFEDGVRLFEERVDKHHDEFKQLLRAEGIEVTNETTLESLKVKESLACFLEQMEEPVASALLLDRQRSRNKKRKKEKDRAVAEFENFVRRSDVASDTKFETVVGSWKEVPAYVDLEKLVGESGVKKVYDDFMSWKTAKEERKLKRKLELNHVSSREGQDPKATEPQKRPRVSVPEVTHYAQAEPREEENGWAAAVSAKPLNESEKLEERERRKREILESISQV